MCSRARDHHVVGQPLGGHPAAVVAHHRDRGHARAAAPPPAPRSRSPSCRWWTCASSTSPSRPWAITWRAKMASVPMSLAIAVRIAESSVRSSAGARRQPARRVAHVGHGVHGVGGRAAVAEREQPPAGVERRAQRGGGGGQHVAALVQRLRAQRPDLVRLHQDRCAHVGEHRVEVGLGLAQERIEEARRARCRAPAAPRGPRRPRCSKNTCTSSHSRW